MDEIKQFFGTVTKKIESLIARVDRLERLDYSAGFAGARVRHDAAQSIAVSSATTLAFNLEDYDTGGLFHDTPTNNSRLVAPVNGYYRITAHVLWEWDRNGRRVLDIVSSAWGTLAESIMLPVQDSSASTGQIVTTDFYMEAGEYVTARVFHTGSGALNILSTSEYSPVFSIHRIK